MPSYDRKAAKEVLGTWFSEVTGLVARDKNNSQLWAGTFENQYSASEILAYGEMILKEVRSIGRNDGKKFVYNESNPFGEEMEIYVHGHRVVRWQIQVWTVNQDLDQDAEYYIDLIRNRLHGHKLKTALKAVSMSVQTMTDTVSTHSTDVDRLYSIATADVFFNAYSRVLDDKVGYVEIVEVSSEFENPHEDKDFTVTIDGSG
jgi:hypothetical protein